MKTKLKYALATLASSIVMSMPVCAETRLLLTGGSDSPMTSGKAYDFTRPDVNFHVIFMLTTEGERGVKFRVRNLAGNADEIFEIQFAPAVGQTLTEGFYDNANQHKWDSAAPHLSIVSSNGGCSYTTGSFDVTQLKISDDGSKILSFAANFSHLCSGQENPLVGEVSYNSDTFLASCNESIDVLTKQVTTLNDSIDDLNSNYTSLITEKASLRDEIDSFGANVTNAQSAKDKIAAELSSSNAGKSILETELASQKAASVDIAASNQELVAQRDELLANRKKLQRRNKTLFKLLRRLN
jgi:regulator of replication initiation timing